MGRESPGPGRATPGPHLGVCSTDAQPKPPMLRGKNEAMPRPWPAGERRLTSGTMGRSGPDRRSGKCFPDALPKPPRQRGRSGVTPRLRPAAGRRTRAGTTAAQVAQAIADTCQAAGTSPRVAWSGRERHCPDELPAPASTGRQHHRGAGEQPMRRHALGSTSARRTRRRFGYL